MKKLIFIFLFKLTLFIGGNSQLLASPLQFNQSTSYSFTANQIASNVLSVLSQCTPDSHFNFSTPKSHYYFSEFSICESEEDSESETFKKNVESAHCNISKLTKKDFTFYNYRSAFGKQSNTEATSRSFIQLRVIRI